MANKNEKINVAIEFSFPLYTCVPSSAAKERGVGRKSETGKEEKKRRASSLGLSLPPPCVSLSLVFLSRFLAFPSPSPSPRSSKQAPRLSPLSVFGSKHGLGRRQEAHQRGLGRGLRHRVPLARGGGPGDAGADEVNPPQRDD